MRRRPTPLTLLACVAGALALTAGACSSSGSDTATGGTAAGGGSGDKPTIVVTTNILGDVVGELVGDEAEVVTIMPVGADPHSFSP
ncbi:MAG: zinc ABC transporter substrate-binding protein, partial [Acidimicrobiales bacterium]|nr:zinc ABC transporter substrate-binding protein [Acidimicrobiales bacterium]